jgi:hypothetical protein
MRVKYDNVTLLEPDRNGDRPVPVSQLEREIPRALSTISAAPLKHAIAPEYPLERVCTNLSRPFQLMFSRNAQQLLSDRADVDLDPSRQGLAIRAESEEAIDAAVVVLRDFYGPKLGVGPLTIRYRTNVKLEQPWMGLRVRCASRHLEAVNNDLVEREGTIVSCEILGEESLIQACAPLFSLMGYGLVLETLTSGSAQHAIWFSHYSPVEDPPPGGHAA